jgi:hypothetical protein
MEGRRRVVMARERNFIPAEGWSGAGGGWVLEERKQKQRKGRKHQWVAEVLGEEGEVRKWRGVNYRE